MTFLNHFLAVLAAVSFVPSTILYAQVMAAVIFRKRSPRFVARSGGVPSTTLLIPAHNEAGVIEQTLAALLPQLNAQTKLLVVADNCTDDTAQIARNIAQSNPNVEVIERFEAALRGKGYALDFGIRHLEANPPEVVIIVDADCELMEGCLIGLQNKCRELNRPIQALYLMDAPPGGGLRSRIAQFAWLVKNQVRPYGDHVMGFPCLLMGSGMAFPWQQIQSATLRTGHIVEDMKLGIEMARAGYAPELLPNAVVKSHFPVSVLGAKTQRVRWEHGHIGMIFADLPSLLLTALKRRDKKLLSLAANLAVPPLALLTVIIGILIAASTSHLALGGGWLALTLSLIDLFLISSAVMLAWWYYARQIISFWQLAGIPFYVLSKLPMYGMFFIQRQTKWVRTKRKAD